MTGVQTCALPILSLDEALRDESTRRLDHGNAGRRPKFGRRKRSKASTGQERLRSWATFSRGDGLPSDIGLRVTSPGYVFPFSGREVVLIIIGLFEDVAGRLCGQSLPGLVSILLDEVQGYHIQLEVRSTA